VGNARPKRKQNCGVANAMKEKENIMQKTKRTVIVVRPEVAARLKKYCTEHGLKLQFAAEQAVAEWLRRQTSEEKK
jgi:hypothetical protein